MGASGLQDSDTMAGETSPPEAGAGGTTEMGGAEGRGVTVEEAINDGLRQLGLKGSDAEVEVLEDCAGRAAGGEDERVEVARVRVRPLNEHTARGRALLEQLLTRMGIPARVSIRRSAAGDGPEGRPAILDITGDDLGLLIGWRGETLRALQTVLNLMMGEDQQGGRRLVLDVEHYRSRREAQVRELVIRMADRVKRSGQRQTLDPMHAYERRVVHLALQDDPGLRTESIGREPARRVVIHPAP